jgi:hypothetical protein
MNSERFAGRMRPRARVVLPLLGTAMLALTMLPSGAGATTAGAQKVLASVVSPAPPLSLAYRLSVTADQVATSTTEGVGIDASSTALKPGLLPDRSCVGLLSVADFPGTHYTGELNSHGEKVCTFAGGTPKVPTGAEVALKVLASTAAAHAFFITISTAALGDLGDNDQYTKLKGYGNEAVYGKVCSGDGTVCGLDVEARVVNDVFTIAVFGVTTPLVKLAGEVVSKLCPKCKFTTSPAPKPRVIVDPWGYNGAAPLFLVGVTTGLG